jgi:hypothetical protein
MDRPHESGSAREQQAGEHQAPEGAALQDLVHR